MGVSAETPRSERAIGGGSTAARAIVVKLLWGVTVLGALALLLRGLWAGVYFEPTGEAIAEARWGQVLVGVACGLLLAAAGYAVLVVGWPLWVACAILAPVVLCGGLTLFASETLLPQLAVLVSYPSALVGVVGGLLAGGRGSRQRGRSPARPDPPPTAD